LFVPLRIFFLPSISLFPMAPKQWYFYFFFFLLFFNLLTSGFWPSLFFWEFGHFVQPQQSLSQSGLRVDMLEISIYVYLPLHTPHPPTTPHATPLPPTFRTTTPAPPSHPHFPPLSPPRPPPFPPLSPPYTHTAPFILTFSVFFSQIASHQRPSGYTIVTNDLLHLLF